MDAVIPGTTTPISPDIASDPEVREAMKQLALASIKHARNLLRTAAPQQQLQMLRILIPNVAKAVSQPSPEGDSELKDAVAKMYGDIRRATGDDE